MRKPLIRIAIWMATVFLFLPVKGTSDQPRLVAGKIGLAIPDDEAIELQGIWKSDDDLLLVDYDIKKNGFVVGIVEFNRHSGTHEIIDFHLQLRRLGSHEIALVHFEPGEDFYLDRKSTRLNSSH